MKVFYEKHRKMLALLLVVAMVFSVTRPGMLQKVAASSDEATVTDAAPAEEVAETDTADVTNDEVTDVADNDESVADSVSDDADEADEDEEEDDPTIMAAKTLHVRVEESKCDITINAPEGSLPYAEDELSVSVKEFTEGSVKYDYYLDKAAVALDQNSPDNISFARFFDIEILANGEKVEPESPVEVKIEYDDALDVAEGADLNIVHFADEGVEVIDDVDLSSNASELTYEQDSFSVTATIIVGALPEYDGINTDDNSPNGNSYYEQGRPYFLVAQKGQNVYTVKEDGTLSPVVSYDSVNNTVVSNDTFAWTFYKQNGKAVLKFVSDGYDYGSDDQATLNGYTFIDPSVDKALSKEPVVKVEKKSDPNVKPNTVTTLERLDDECELDIDFNLNTIKSIDGKYLTIDENENRIVGGADSANGVKFYFANPDQVLSYVHVAENTAYGHDSYPLNMIKNHQVNHIDISIKDNVQAEIKLAYGMYYDENGNHVLTINKNSSDSDRRFVINQEYEVSQKHLREAVIETYKRNPDGSVGDKLENQFIVTGYSSNNATEFSENQVRIDGIFKVANCAPLNIPDNEVGLIWAVNFGSQTKEDRLDNRILYKVTAVEPDVDFMFEHPIYGQLYDAEGNKLSKKGTVTVESTFDYFDDKNECPPLQGSHPNINGEILSSGTSGMDFVLGGTATISGMNQVAINISNDLRDSNGNIIKPKDPVKDIKFNVVQNIDNSNPDSVFDKNIEQYQGYDPEMNLYDDNTHSKNTTIGTSGSGLVYDYDVYPGMVDVEEDIDTVPKVVVDQDGNTWIYRYSYIETENVNRGDGKKDLLHVGNQSSTGMAVATPEVLGDYTDINSGDRFSEFVEFFAHNVYDKVIPPTKEEVSPYQGNGELGGVCAGDQITYSINYTNYSSSAEDIVIKDKLDENVEFVSASNGGTESDGVVTWNLDSVPAGQKGSVTLTVKVLETALESNGGPGTVINGGDTATVQVGNDPVFKLDEVLNPVTMPSKMEVSPYEGNGLLGNVTVGEEIVYEITYKNYKDSAADIVITDKLDPNVEFVEASDGGKNEDGTVKWTLSNVPAGKEGSVTLTVKVLRSALSSKGGPGEIVNGGKTSTVKVGNDKAYSLDLVKNPVVDTPETLVAPHKREVSPYVGNGKLGEVKVGEKIVYEISYTNYLNDPADIVIVDKLDANVEFVEASDDGVYDKDAGTVTWTIKDVPSEKEGKVTLTVKVLESALAAKNGPGKVLNGGETATVQVGNDAIFTLEEVENPVITSSTKSKTDKTTTAVKTGDSMPIIPIIIVMAVALAGIISVIVIRRKKAKNEPEKNK